MRLTYCASGKSNPSLEPIKTPFHEIITFCSYLDQGNQNKW